MRIATWLLVLAFGLLTASVGRTEPNDAMARFLGANAAVLNDSNLADIRAKGIERQRLDPSSSETAVILWDEAGGHRHGPSGYAQSTGGTNLQTDSISTHGK